MRSIQFGKSLFLNVIGFVIIFPAISTADQRWFVEIPQVAGTNSCTSTGISGDGKTVLGYCDTPFTRTTYRWTADAGLVPFSSNIKDARAASFDGSVIVGIVGQHAMRWTAATGPMDLGAIPSTASSTAQAVSSDGSVIVGLGNSLSISGNGYLWTAQTGMSLLPLLPGTTSTSPNSISADGQTIAGNTRIGSNSNAIRWTATDGITNIGTLSPSPFSYSQTNGMSGDGSTIIGVSNGRPFRWSQATGMLAIPAGFFGNASGNAYSASYDGSMIVGSSIDSFSPQSAFLWTSQAGTKTIQQILGPFVPSGWQLTNANGMSADGQTIVGSGSFGGQTRAWVAHIPEPGSTTFWLSATLIIVVLKRNGRPSRNAT